MSAAAPVPAHHVVRAYDGTPADRVRLDYDGRFLRRKVLTGEGGLRILVDLDQTVSLDEGDAFVLDDGRHVAVVADAEPLTEVSGPDLPRLAWHIGNRHTPCEISSDGLRIRRDRVMSDMLARLGATLTDLTAPFRPEGGAYGHGRTHGHSHGEAEGGPHRHPHHHDHDHGHDHDHDHAHGHSHGHSHGHGH
ncbi:hypothetical protein ATO6_09390 [Oceanicola sp. 22II-s10i]|uniref:urease accessory protein UreE n=1 Tax=Oceanicola sp. 22II-s10i TaxID=1317116 RepID=UPI000B51FDFC|nr:urease accessory protein UreE [Oceanicola sp. 22II-s10i]OWU85231.1 hypothetical protein ATO6_09390 [Oceanicola sp. 22II-s10i]